VQVVRYAAELLSRTSGIHEGTSGGEKLKRRLMNRKSVFSLQGNQSTPKQTTPTLKKSTNSELSFLLCTLFFSLSNDAEIGLAGGHAYSKE
jgi:hypothetical protein